MERDELKLNITSLVDNEITDERKENELRDLISKDSELRFEYNVQLLMKNLVKDKCGFVNSPEKLKKKVVKKIKPSSIKSEGSSSNIFSRPIIAYGTLGTIVLAIILLVLNRTPEAYYDFAIEQRGKENMFIQAQNNFQSILEGKLAPQLISGNPEEIKKYFKEEGVNYSTVVPEYNQWNLLGAVVSEDGGEKFAHHVYTGEENKLIYLFQVDESFLKNNEIVSLSDDLLNYLNEGKCYTSTNDNIVTLMTKTENNILAVVSNISLNELEENFCQIK